MIPSSKSSPRSKSAIIFRTRYNPDTWKVDGVTQSVPKAHRDDYICKIISGLQLTTPLAIGYAYYDSTAGDLDVLANPNYHTTFAQIATDITPNTLI